MDQSFAEQYVPSNGGFREAPITLFSRVSYENDSSRLLAEGILDSISAGILLYDGLVAIIVPYFSSSLYCEGSRMFRWGSIVVLWFGAAAMAVVGYWA